MASWRVATSLTSLLNEIKRRYPSLPGSAFGTIGDAAHQKRASRHNPNRQGVVTALDVNNDPGHGFNAHAFADQLVALARAGRTNPDFAYIISNHRIASRDKGWVWRKFTGSDPHTGHIHVAVGQGSDSNVTGGYDTNSSWLSGSANAAEQRMAISGNSGPLTGAALAADAAYKAGFRGDDLIRMVAIAGGESGWNPKSHNPKPPDNSYGLWQINMLGSMGPSRRREFGISSNEQLFDPYVNARAAMAIYKSQGWRAWTVYTRSTYKKYMNEATSTVQSYLAGGGARSANTNIQAFSGGAGGTGATLNPQQMASLAVAGMRYALGVPFMPMTPGYTGLPAGGSANAAESGLFAANAAITNAGAILGAAAGLGSYAAVDPYGNYTDPGADMTPVSGTGGVSFSAPGGGEVWHVANGENYAVYNIGAAKIAFQTDGSGVDTSGMPERDMSFEEWAGSGTVVGGSADELSSMTDSWDAWVERLMMTMFGRNNPARDDPEVQAVIAEFAARPDMDPNELQNRLKSTQYYQKMTLAQAQWNDLPEGEKTKQRDTVAQQMVDTIFEVMGQNVAPNDPLIQNYLEDVASGKVGYGSFTAAVKAKALENPESPWSRQIRGEGEAQRQRPWDTENMALKVKEEGRKWGVRLSAAKAQEYAQGIVELRVSEDDLRNDLKQMSSIRYPTKPPDMETGEWAQQWIETYQRLMEKPADVFTPEIQKALSTNTPVADFERERMSDPRWRGTKNGMAAIANAVSGVGRIFGFQTG